MPGRSTGGGSIAAIVKQTRASQHECPMVLESEQVAIKTNWPFCLFLPGLLGAQSLRLGDKFQWFWRSP